MTRRAPVTTFEEISPEEARAMIADHHRALAYSGDSFLPTKQLSGHHVRISLDGRPCGTMAHGDNAVTLVRFDAAGQRRSRQIVAQALAVFGLRQGFVASWDARHVDLLGGFATGIDNQAHQFQLLDVADLCDPLPGLRLRAATDQDLAYLDGTGFQPDFAELVAAGQVRVAWLAGRPAGIALLVPHVLDAARTDIGMFCQPELRGRGLGQSIVALTAREVLAAGRTPVAGCWWRNWLSRPTLEAAGLTCIGTILHLALDPHRFEPHVV